MYGAKAWAWTMAGIGMLLTAEIRFLRNQVAEQMSESKE
jgi:hypothetical protein